MTTLPGRVTLRAPVLLQVIGIPVVGFFALGISWAVVDAFRTGDADRPFESSGIHGLGVVVGWTIAIVLGIPCVFALIMLPMLRVRFGGDRVRWRKLFRYKTVRLDDLTSVIVTNPPSWMVNGFRSSVAPCLEIRGLTPAGRRAYIGINAKMLDYTAALRWLAPWLRAHPDRSDANTLTMLDHLDDRPPEPGTPGAQLSVADLRQELRREDGGR